VGALRHENATLKPNRPATYSSRAVAYFLYPHPPQNSFLYLCRRALGEDSCSALAELARRNARTLRITFGRVALVPDFCLTNLSAPEHVKRSSLCITLKGMVMNKQPREPARGWL